MNYYTDPHDSDRKVKVSADHRDFGSTPFVKPAPHDRTLLETAGIRPKRLQELVA